MKQNMGPVCWQLEELVEEFESPTQASPVKFSTSTII
jgi:hypothetical protein